MTVCDESVTSYIHRYDVMLKRINFLILFVFFLCRIVEILTLSLECLIWKKLKAYHVKLLGFRNVTFIQGKLFDRQATFGLPVTRFTFSGIFPASTFRLQSVISNNFLYLMVFLCLIYTKKVIC